jgi:hypothetical protein
MPRVNLGEQRIDVSRAQPSAPTTVFGSNGIPHQLGHPDSPGAQFGGHRLVLRAQTDVQELGPTPRSHVADHKDVTSLRQAAHAKCRANTPCAPVCASGVVHDALRSFATSTPGSSSVLAAVGMIVTSIV